MLQWPYLRTLPFIRRMNYAFALAFKWQSLCMAIHYSWAHIYTPSLTVKKKVTLGWNKHTFSNLYIFKAASHQPLVHFNNRMAVWLPRRDSFHSFHFLFEIMFTVIWEGSVFTGNRPRSLHVEVVLTVFLSYFSMLNEWGTLCWNICLQERS